MRILFHLRSSCKSMEREALGSLHDHGVDCSKSVTTVTEKAPTGAGCEFVTSTCHLQGLAPAFASDVDTVLCLSNGGTAVEFPVHSTVLSAESPVICSLLQSLSCRQADTEQTDITSQKLRMPMFGDTQQGVQDVLAVTYLPFASDRTAALSRASSSESHHAIVIAHKYGMTQLVTSLESTLVDRIKTAYATEQASAAAPGHVSTLPTTVLDAQAAIAYAAAADKCQLKYLLAYSEAYIVQHFHENQFQDKQLGHQLSGQSFFRIAKALANRHASESRQMLAAVSAAATEAETAIVRSQSLAQFLLYKCGLGFMGPSILWVQCPRDNCKGHLELVKHSKRYKTSYCSNTWCEWPEPKTQSPGPSMQTLVASLTSWQ